MTARPSAWALALASLTGCASIHNDHVAKGYAAMMAQCPTHPPSNYVEVANCQNRAIYYKYQNWNPPDYTGAELLGAANMRTAEQLDAGEITPGQAQEILAKVNAQINDAEYQRALQQQKLEMQQLQMFMAPAPVIYTNPY